MKKQLDLARRQWLYAALAVGAGTLTGCSLLPWQEAEQSTQQPHQKEDVAEEDDGSVVPKITSVATTLKAYRLDAASHLYTLNPDRIYKGKLPPLLYAVGVLSVTVDHLGNVQAVRWARAPQHAPEVMEEIVRMVYKASPLPAPTQLGSVVYTDTWLWHKSGKFQLDTLSEGQY